MEKNGLRRIYHSSVLESLAFMALGRQSDFSLDEIAQMFTVEGKIKIDKKKLYAKALEIEESIKRLQALKKEPFHAAHCPAKNHTECPTLYCLLRVAKKQQIKKTKLALNSKKR